MRIVSLILVAIGALFIPFAGKRLILALSDRSAAEIRSGMIIAGIGAVLIVAGLICQKRLDGGSVWRDRSRPRRIRLK